MTQLLNTCTNSIFFLTVWARTRVQNDFYHLHSLRFSNSLHINPLNAELNPICHLLALAGAHHFVHVSRLRVKSSFCICHGGRYFETNIQLKASSSYVLRSEIFVLIFLGCDRALFFFSAIDHVLLTDVTLSRHCKI
jgi:hypothetical protein